MTTSLVWPRTVLVPTKAGPPNMQPNNISGGTGFGGSEQTIGNTPGRWQMKFGNVSIRTSAQVLAWNSIKLRLRGRANPILIPLYDRQRAPNPPVTAVTSGAIAAGAASMNIKITAGGVIAAGMHFSVAERLYGISLIDSVSGTPPIYVCETWPPVRDPIADNVALEFADPYFRVRLAADNGMDTELDLLKFASPTVEFVEDVGGNGS